MILRRSVIRSLFRRGAPIAVAAILGMAPSAAPAAAVSAAGTPGWRIMQLLPNFATGGLAAIGARDAWLAGDRCADSQCDRDTLIVRHWNGRAWRAVTPPKAFIDSALGAGAGGVAATSASNAWVFADRGNDQVSYTEALHWTGRGWAAPVRFNTGIEAASATDVWAFGDPEAYPQNGFIAHFDGKTWRRGTFPITVSSVSALSVTDIWASGDTRGGVPGIEHWDGHHWRATPLPSLGFSDSNPGFIMGVAALTPRDVWADYFVSNTAPHTILLHWNGTAWKRAAFAYPGALPSPVVADGHGGIWVPIDTGNPPALSIWMAHFSDGRWTKTAVPRRDGEQPDIFYSSRIPGTRSIWATGSLDFNVGEAILKFGP